MGIEFDPAKDAANRAKHKVSLILAGAVLADPSRIDTVDMRFVYDEERDLSLGRVQGRIFVVVWIPRGGRYRIISVRKATKHEAEQYYQEQA